MVGKPRMLSSVALVSPDRMLVLLLDRGQSALAQTAVTRRARRAQAVPSRRRVELRRGDAARAAPCRR